MPGFILANFSEKFLTPTKFEKTMVLLSVIGVCNPRIVMQLSRKQKQELLFFFSS